jgi:hypothetical protein
MKLVSRRTAGAVETVAETLAAVAQPLARLTGSVYPGDGYLPLTSRSKRGLPRSGAKFGSILSQPGER